MGVLLRKPAELVPQNNIFFKALSGPSKKISGLGQRNDAFMNRGALGHEDGANLTRTRTSAGTNNHLSGSIDPF